MWSVAFVVLIVAVLTTAAADEFSSAVHEFLRDYIDLEQGEVGMVVGLVDERGTRVIGHGRTRTGGAEVNGDTVFEIGSVTKPFTALLLQDVVAQGQMQPDEPVAKYLPRSVRLPTRGWNEITLLHLASHTSGLPRDPDNLRPRYWANGLADYSVENLYAFLSIVICTSRRQWLLGLPKG